ncbi:MAG: hypothetical protein M1835_002502 [Candelina submexicana]|nr:MAG: hypothetical protein M1835_002502 [Candelina submexicana]
MNRFRSRKKSTGASTPRSASDDSEVPSLPIFSGKSFRKNKKAQPEPKPEVDLSTALPSSDDFRTSLLMPNLSARFSMLREQDDPTSKLGKANDDSVLHPKRKSRLGDFGFQPGRGPLTDIAEVGSIRAPIRPPFASVTTGSYASGDGYSTDDDSSSMISRPRPGEGNNLFGGRQKIYKIPIGGSASSRNVDESGNQVLERGMGGRALYGDDVSMSAFQKLREKERENERLAEPDSHQDLDIPLSDHTNSSLSSTCNKNRDTISSTTSGPSNARISSAATSIASQGANSVPIASAPPPNLTPGMSTAHAASSASSTVPERSMTKSRRLYEQGLDQHLYDQQSSAASRLELLQRQRALGGGVYAPHSSHIDKTPNAHDRHHRQGPPPASFSNGSRAASPPPPASADAALGKFNLGIGESKRAESPHHPINNFTRPTSPTAYSQMRSMSHTSEEEDSFAAAVQPKDRGKATAMGTFNKPSRQYDELQYSQRQKQMQRGRDTPTPPLGRVSPPRTTRAPPQESTRSGNESSVSFRSRSASAAGRIHLIKPESHAPMANGSSPVKKSSPTLPSPILPDPHGTFLAPATPDDVGSPVNGPLEGDRQQPSFDQSQFRRPADIMAAMQNIQQASPPPGGAAGGHPEIMRPSIETNQVQKIDVPTAPTPAGNKENTVPGIASSEFDNDSLSPGPNGGLHGLVSAHLRSDSGQSSIYTAPSPRVSKFSHTRQRSGQSGPSPAKPNIGRRPGHEFDNWDGGYYQDSHGYRPASPIPLSKPDHSIPNGVSSKAMKVLGEQPNRTSHRSSHSGHLPEDNILNDVPSKAKQILGEQPTPDTHDASKSGLQPENRKLNGISTKPLKVLGQEAEGPVRRSQESSRDTRLPGEGRIRHTKNASTETQREREDFANELAHRRMKVQENLKSFAESESRSASPAPSIRREYPKDHHIKPPGAFGMLKTKTSRGSLATRPEKPDAPPKALKMLGMAGPNPYEQPAQPRESNEDRRREQEERMLRGFRSHPQMMNKPLQQTRHDMQRDHRQRQRGNSDENSDSSSNKEPSPQSSRSSAADRSSSDASGGRSKSRSGRYRDDLHKAMAEGAGSVAYHGYPDMSREMPRSRKFSNSPVPSPEAHQQVWEGHSSPALSGRLRSNSKSGYFDSTTNSLHPVQTSSSAPIGALRTSPVTPCSANSTPPVSAGTTPTTGVAPQSFASTNRVPTHRKRSINKYDISEPIFMHGTSNITTVNLVPGASLSNGIESPPPVPAFSPRRKRTTTTQAFLTHFGRSDKAEQPSMTQGSMPSPQEGLSTFSADEGENRPRHRHKLRKSSSEGGNLNVKARQQAMNAPSPAMPKLPPSLAPTSNSPPGTFDGGMF